MVNYKRYLYTNEKMPRSTRKRRRRKAAEDMLRLLHHQEEQMTQYQHIPQVPPSTNGTTTEGAQDFQQVAVSDAKLDYSPLSSVAENITLHSEDIEGNVQMTQDQHKPQVPPSGNGTGPEGVQDFQQLPICDQQFDDSPLSPITENITLHSEDSDGNASAVTERGQSSAAKAPSPLKGSTSANEPFVFDQNNSDEPPSNQLPLCSHTECTVGDVIVMCLSLGFRHNLTWAAQVDMLRMINVIYGEEKIPATKYGYLKQLQNNEKLGVTYHVYCPSCDAYLGKKDSPKVNVHCLNCDGHYDVSKSTNFFVSLSLESQLKKLMEDSKIADLILNHRFSRQKENSGALEDIYDGSEYKTHSAAGQILSSPQNFSYSFFTDGVPLGKSAKKTLWPIYITVNELPPKERSKYVLLCGLYVGSHDPNQNVFMKPFVDEANILSTVGFTWSHNGQEVVSKVIPLVAIADSVARCQLLNFQSFHAYYGCTFCYQKQTRTIRRLKFTLPTKQVEDRTLDSTDQDLQKAFHNRHESKEADRHCRGVKGPSALMQLLYFNFICGFVVDYMHCILVGVIKTHAELLFDSMRRKCWKYFGNDILAIDDLFSEIDRRLLSIKPPSSITRTPRSIKEWKLWKASEWRSWLLFYSIPCLTGLLKRKYLMHIAMLSKATNLLLQKSVSHAEVEEAHRLFMWYSFRFQKHFGEEHMYYNIHLLSHICKCVLRWGPLWTHNAFWYEGQNRHLLQLSKSPYHVVLEISRKYLLFKSIPRLFSKFASHDNTLYFCEDVLQRHLIRFVRSNGTVLLGKGEQPCLLEGEEECLKINAIIGKECLSYQRMLHKGMRISTYDYSQGKKNNDSYVFTTQNKVYVVKFILLPPTSRVTLLVESVSVQKGSILSEESFSLQHVYKLTEYGNLACLDPDSIKSQGVVMDTYAGTYLSSMPFGCYGD